MLPWLAIHAASLIMTVNIPISQLNNTVGTRMYSVESQPPASGKKYKANRPLRERNPNTYNLILK